MASNSSFQSFVNLMSAGANPPNTPRDLNTYARVIHVVLGPKLVGSDTNDPYYDGPTSIGSIAYQLLKSNQGSSSDSAGNPVAYPLNANLKKYPLEGEIVRIVPGPSNLMNEDFEAPRTYYEEPINLWNSSHHNAFPGMPEYAQFVNQGLTRTYEESIIAGQPENLTPSAVNFPLGPNFFERNDIKTLLPFPGDVILEGRWGNSIRFGSTQFFQKELSNWSRDTGSLGNPITIIRNGQGRALDPDAWVPTVEDINRDPSSIYLTQGQKIVIDDIQRNFSLITLGVTLESTYTNAVPLQQALTSIDSLSPAEQDARTDSVTPTPQTPEVTSTVPEPTPTTSTTVETTTVPSGAPNITPPVPQNLKGTYLRDYTNSVGNVFELYSTKKGFNTTIYAYKKQTGVLVKTGTPSSTAPLDALIREMELSLVDNAF